MTLSMEYKIEGAEELMKKLDNKTLLAAPIRQFFQQSSHIVKRRTKELTPVDIGRLKASFSHIIDSSPVPLWALIGSDVFYAPFVEAGTKPHFPPTSALKRWARVHHFSNVFLLCLTIARRGTKARRMLQRGFEESKGKINELLKQMGDNIKGEWQK
mgnify:CR=1 FL=1